MASSLLLLFTLGIFSSLSPCIFPVFSSFLAYTANAENSAKKGMLVGFVCLLGIALSFSIYGILASLLFAPLIAYQTILRSIFGIIIILLGITMYTQKIKVYISTPKKLLESKGYLEVFILGLSYAIIAAPCAMPIFLSAFITASALDNALLTVINLVAFAIGSSLPFFISPLLVIGTKNILRSQSLILAKWFRLLSSSILVLTGLLLFLPILGFPSVFD